MIDRMLGHDAWATRLLLERCRDLTPAQYTRKFPMGPGTVHDAMLHVVAAMGRWADRIGDRPLRPSLEDEGRTWTPDEISAKLDEFAADLAAVAEQVTRENRVNEMMEVRIRGYEKPFHFTRGTAIMHVTTHGVHHRAQVLNMLRHLGLEDLPDVDAVEWEIGSGS